MTRVRRRRQEDPVTFDFAPMVDIVLLLLIFFFLTSNLADSRQALPLDLPRADATVQETPNLPVVSVKADGSLALRGEPVTLEALGQQLPPLLKASGGLVGLRADQGANYGRVTEVMDVIKGAGGTRLALGTAGPRTAPAPGGNAP